LRALPINKNCLINLSAVFKIFNFITQMSIHQIYKSIQEIGSIESLQSWDKTGVLIDSKTPENSQKMILLCIDFTLSVLQEL
jgi:hypothetical protein